MAKRKYRLTELGKEFRTVSRQSDKAAGYTYKEYQWRFKQCIQDNFDALVKEGTIEEIK